MQPLGRVPTRFPGKRDCHPPRGYENWWEHEINTASNKFSRQAARKEIELELLEIFKDATMKQVESAGSLSAS